MIQPASGGYWLIELEETAALCADSKLHPFARRLLQWVAKSVSKKLHLESKLVELTTIEANYHGTYPRLSARHASGAVPDELADQIVTSVRDTLAETSISQFVVSLA